VTRLPWASTIERASMSTRGPTLRMTPSEIAISARASPRPCRRAFRTRMSAIPDVTAGSRSLLRSYDRLNRLDQIAACHTLLSNPGTGMPVTTARALRFRFIPGHDFAFSRRAAPEFFLSLPPSSNQRAQGRPGARCTRGLVCNVHKECAHEHTGLAESIRPSLRNGFTAYSALPGDRLSCHRRP
jgi:hypothetical protein